MESIETVIVVFIAGLALLLIGVYKRNERSRLMSVGIHVKGVVFQVINDGKTYYPVVRFTTEANDLVTRKYFVNANQWTYKEGQSVNVIYDPVNPGHFILDDGLGKSVGPGFIWAGIVLIVISIGLLILGLRG